MDNDSPLTLGTLAELLRHGQQTNQGLLQATYRLSPDEVRRWDRLRTTAPRTSGESNAGDRRECGLTYQMLHRRLAARYPEMPAEATLEKQLSGQRAIDLRVLDAALTEVGTSLRAFLCYGSAYPFLLDDLIVSLELLMRSQPTYAVAFAERLSGLLNRWRDAQRRDPAAGEQIITHLIHGLADVERSLQRS